MAKKEKGIIIPKGALKAGAKKFAEGGDDFEDLDLERGSYTAILIGGRLVKTDNGVQAVVDVKVPEVSAKAKKGIFFNLEDEERSVWFFRMVNKVLPDVEVPDTPDTDWVNEILEKIEEDRPVIKLKASPSKDGEYMNLRIDKLLADLTASEVEDEAAGESEDDEDEKPKKGKKEKAEKEDEDEEESDDEDSEDEEEDDKKSKKKDKKGKGDELDELERVPLKKLIAKEELDIKVDKSMSDDDVRAAIREAREEKGDEGEDDEKEESDDEDEEEAPKSKKDKKSKKSKEDEDESDEEDSDDDDEKEEDAEEGVKPKKGMKVTATIEGKEVEATIAETPGDDDTKLRVKRKSDGKVFKLSPEKVEFTE